MGKCGQRDSGNFSGILVERSLTDRCDSDLELGS
jgi:hypothetical protein